MWARRHSILAALTVSYLVCYLDRMAMASAIPFIAAEFGLSPLAMGGVLSAFFFGYAIMQIPGGLLADKFGPARIMAGAVVAWSVFTGMTALATSLTGLLVIRFLFGLSEGPFPPSAAKAIGMTFPNNEVGRASSIQMSAVNIGAALAPLIVAPMVVYWGWRSVFLTLLIPGLVLAPTLLWSLRGARSRFNATNEQKASHPFAALRRAAASPALLWCAASLFFANLAGWGLMNWLPTYLLQARGFSVAAMGMLAPLPYLVGAGGYILGGAMLDGLFRRRPGTLVAGGLLLGALATIGAALAPSGAWAIFALVFAFLFLFVATACLYTLPLLVASSDATGGAFGLVNTAGQIAAFLSPLLVGAILERTGGDFTFVLCAIAASLVASALASSWIGRVSDAQH